MRSNIFNLNYETFDIHDPEQRKQLMGALQYYCALPNKFVHERFAKVKEFILDHQKVREFTLMSDGWTNEKAIDILKSFHMTPVYDMGYEQVFEVADYTGSKASGFDVAAVRSGLTVKEVKEGEKLKVYQMAGAKERVYFCYYGAALGWHRRLFEDGDWWTVEKTGKEFRNKHYGKRAAVFYALLEAGADAKTCCAQIPSDCPDDCDADARSIARSLNYAAMNILETVKDRGYTIDPQTTVFKVVTPLRLRGRVRYALGQRMQAFADSERLIDYNFQQVTSMMLQNHDRIIVALPGETMIAGYRSDLELLDDFDILSLTSTVAGWMRYGGCIGDIDQLACIDLTAESGSCPPGDFVPKVACGKNITEQIIDL